MLMKKILLSLLAICVFAIGVQDTHASSFLGFSARADVAADAESGGSLSREKDDNAHGSLRSDGRFNGKIIGTVTAVNGSTLEVKSRDNVAYTIDIENSKIRRGSDSIEPAEISVGDAIFVQGMTNGTKIFATNVLDMQGSSVGEHASDRSRLVIVGTVTAVSENSLTVVTKDNSVYTVNTATATIKANHTNGSERGGIAVEDRVVVSGVLTGSTIAADTVTEARSTNGFFIRIGAFFRSIFGMDTL